MDHCGKGEQLCVQTVKSDFIAVILTRITD